MRKYLNGSDIPLSVAVWLAHDSYDHEDHTISATALLDPVRRIVLSSRLSQEQALVDITSLVKSRMGHAIHDGIERAWTDNYVTALKALGYPQRVIDRVVVNPPVNANLTDMIPVYLEQRSYREIDGVTVSGKFDFVAEGRVEDFKSTSTFTWKKGNKTEDYQLQGSIYRWLNPRIVTADELFINFIFTDWKPGFVKSDPKYPPRPIMRKPIPLLSLAETEHFIRSKLTEIKRCMELPEEELPPCSDKDLWRDDPVWKYYKNPDKMTRSTKNFDSKQEAYNRLAADGGVGTVVEVPGKAVACRYCSAFPLCTQKDALVASGDLVL